MTDQTTPLCTPTTPVPTITPPPPGSTVAYHPTGIELRSLPDWPGYWAGADGIIYSDKRTGWFPLTPQLNRKLRMYVVSVYHPGIRYWRKNANYEGGGCMAMRPSPIYIHALVASVWLPPKPGPDYVIDHIDENRTNNRPDNLDWKTNGDNIRKSNPSGFSSPGSKNPMAKLTESDIPVIRALRGQEIARVVARRYNIARTTVLVIWAGKTWRHVPKESTP